MGWVATGRTNDHMIKTENRRMLCFVASTANSSHPMQLTQFLLVLWLLSSRRQHFGAVWELIEVRSNKLVKMSGDQCSVPECNTLAGLYCDCNQTDYSCIDLTVRTISVLQAATRWVIFRNLTYAERLRIESRMQALNNHTRQGILFLLHEQEKKLGLCWETFRNPKTNIMKACRFDAPHPLKRKLWKAT